MQKNQIAQNVCVCKNYWFAFCLRIAEARIVGWSRMKTKWARYIWLRTRLIHVDVIRRTKFDSSTKLLEVTPCPIDCLSHLNQLRYFNNFFLGKWIDAFGRLRLSYRCAMVDEHRLLMNSIARMCCMGERASERACVCDAALKPKQSLEKLTLPRNGK